MVMLRRLLFWRQAQTPRSAGVCTIDKIVQCPFGPAMASHQMGSGFLVLFLLHLLCTAICIPILAGGIWGLV